MNKRAVKVLSLLTMIIMFFSSVAYVYADEEDDLINQQSSVNDEIKNKEKQIDDVKNQMSTNMKQIDNLNSQIDSFEDEIANLEDKLEVLNGQIETKKQEVDEKQKAYEENEELLKKRLVASYKVGKVKYLDVLLNANSLSDFLSKYFLLEKLAAHDTDLLNKIQKEKEELEAQKAELEKEQKEAEEEAEKLKLRREALAVVISDKKAMINNLSATEKELQEEVEDLRETDSNIRAQLKKIREAKIPVNVIDQGNSYSGAVGGGGLSYPIKHVATSATYGQAGRYWSLGYHTGLDFVCSDGTAIYAAATGQVVESGFSRAYGWHVIIYHPDLRIFTLYAHASSLEVSYGEYVSRGERIMLSGHSGNVTGPHMHFEVRVGNGGFRECVDPENYLP